MVFRHFNQPPIEFINLFCITWRKKIKRKQNNSSCQTATTTKARNLLKITQVNTSKWCVFWLVTKTSILSSYFFFKHNSGFQNMGLFMFREESPVTLQFTPQSNRPFTIILYSWNLRQLRNSQNMLGWRAEMLKLNKEWFFYIVHTVYIPIQLVFSVLRLKFLKVFWCFWTSTPKDDTVMCWNLSG
jgi:hypothetical protein